MEAALKIWENGLAMDTVEIRTKLEVGENAGPVTRIIVLS